MKKSVRVSTEDLRDLVLSIVAHRQLIDLTFGRDEKEIESASLAMMEDVLIAGGCDPELARWARELVLGDRV